MASEQEKMDAILHDYELALEDLTFNSKPIINDLTMAAGKYTPIASKIVEKIEARILQVSPEHKLPSVYLLDSIMKNLRGAYLEHFSKNIVRVFCHCFEKLTDPKIRISLYKLRQTWTPFLPSRKLAAIDRHVHSLDPNWPITAVDTSGPGPAIYVNPNFIGASSNSKPTKSASPSPSPSNSQEASDNVDSRGDEKMEVEAVKGVTKKKETQGNGRLKCKEDEVKLKVTWDPRTSRSPSEEPARSSGEGLSLQDRRRQLLEQQRKKRQQQEKVMGVPTQSSLTPPLSSSLTKNSQGRRSLSPQPGGRGVSPAARSRLTPPLSSSLAKDSQGRRSQSPQPGGRGVSPAARSQLTPPLSSSLAKTSQGRRSQSPQPGGRGVSPTARSRLTPSARRSPKRATPSPISEDGEGGGGEGGGKKESQLLTNHTGSKRKKVGKGKEKEVVEGGGKEEAKEAAHGGREDSPKLTKEADSYAPEGRPPPKKRPCIKVEISEDMEVEDRDSKTKGEEMEDTTPPKAIKQSTLDLDDIPVELLTKHQEFMRKQVEQRLKAGNLTEDQHKLLMGQLEQLYELQRKKEAEKSQPSLPKLPENETSSSRQQTQTDRHTSSQSLHVAPPPHTNTPVHSNKLHPFIKSERHGPPFPSHPPVHHPPMHDRFPFRPRFRGRGLRPRRGWAGRNRGPFRPPRDSRGPFPPPPPHPRMDLPPHGPPHWEPTEQASSSQPQVVVGDLFTKLVELGVLKDDSQQQQQNDHQPSPPPPSAHPPAVPAPGPSSHEDKPPEQPPFNVPNLSFTPATLKHRYGSLVSLLHVGEPCASCGIRFTSRSGPEYRRHLDWHFAVNRREADGKQRSSRNWFMHPEDWLKYEELADSEDKEPPTITYEPESKEEDQLKEEVLSSCEVLPGEGNEVCSICQEPFEQFWEEEQEEWHFRDAMRTDDGKLYHNFCYQDSKESGTLDDSGASQLPSPDPDATNCMTFGDLL